MVSICGISLSLGSPLPISAGLGSLSPAAKRCPVLGVVCLKFRKKLLLRPNLWYYAVDERSRLKEWHLWEILTEAKRSPNPFFDSGAKAANILPLNKTEKSKNRRRKLWEIKARRIKVRRKPKKSLRKTNRRPTKKTSPATSSRSTHMRGGSHQPAPIPSHPAYVLRHCLCAHRWR